MGTAPVRRLGLPRGGARGRGLVALTLLALPVTARPQEDGLVGDCDALVQELGQRLREDDGSMRAVLLDELAAVGAEVARVLDAGPEDPARAHLVLYKALAAQAEFALDRPLEARAALLREARDHADRSGEREPMARVRVLEAELYLEHGRLSRAQWLLERALEEVPEAELTRPFVLHALAEAEQRLGWYARALEHLDQARAAVRDGPAWARLAWRLPGTRAQVYLDLGLADVAAPFVAQELEAVRGLRAEGLRWAKDLIAAHVHAANLALARGRPEDVVDWIERCLADDELYAAWPRWRAVLLGVEGEALGRLEQADPTRERRARELLARALDGDPPVRDRMAFEVRLARLATHDGELDRARALLASARARLERWRADQAAHGPIPEKAVLAAEEARLALAAGAGRPELEARLATLLEASAARLALWAETPLREGGLGYLHQPARRGWLSEIVRLCVALEGPERGAARALVPLLEAQDQGTLLRAAGEAGQATLEAVRDQLLGPDHGILVLLPGPDQSHWLVLDGAGTLAVELAGGDRLRPLVEVARRRLDELRTHPASGTGADDAAREALDALGRALLPATLAARVRGWRALTVVGLELLGPVPFELLAFDGRRPLGEELAVDHLPSLPLGLLLARRARERRPRPFDLVLVVAPRAGPAAVARWPEVASLPVAPAATRALEAAYDPARRRTLWGAAATPAALFGPAAPGEPGLVASTRVLQLVVHGVEDEDRERPPVLVLGPDAEGNGCVGCAEVQERATHAPQLVVLTTCRAGSGPLRRGDGAIGHMGGAWLAAGAGAVVLSDAELTLGPALALSRTLHERIALHGDAPAEALRRARVELALRGPGFDGGLLQVLGLGQHALFAPREAGREPAQGARGRGWLLVAGLAAAFSVTALCAALLARRAATSVAGRSRP